MHRSRLEKIVLGAFLFWFACGFIFTLGRIGPGTVETWALPSWLRAFIEFCLAFGDPALILLAFANTHLLAARHWGSAPARRWALIVVLLSFAVETCGALTGFPFGHYFYTNAFGPRLGVVPLTIPLAWHVVLTNVLFMVRTLGPNLPRWLEAALVGLGAELYDMALEPFATAVKEYWKWTDSPESYAPAQNYLAWFVIGTLLALVFAPATTRRAVRDWRPTIILGTTVILFIAGACRGGAY
jgi:uncharacterized membrane protein